MRALRPLLLLPLLACGRACSGPAPAPPAPPAAQASPEADRARELALRQPGGARPVDQRIAELQAAAGRTNKADAWVLLGQAWVRKARESTDPVYYLNADACADLALAAQADYPPALDLRGLVLLNEHRFEEARALAARDVARDPQRPMAYAALSDALLELGRTDEAAAAAQRMVDLKPNLPSYSRAAYLQWLRGDEKAALESARLAIDAGQDRRDPEPRAWVIVQAAMIFWHRGDLAGAEAGFNQALSELPDYPPALAGLGRVALARGQAPKAVEVLEKSFRASPLLETLWLLGDARAAAGDAAGAEREYAAVLKNARADPRTASLFLSAKQREPARALELAREDAKGRGDLYTRDALAFALLRAGQLAEARAASDQALALGTPDARLLFHAGAIRLAQGEAEAGRGLLKRALGLNPHFDVSGAAEAEALLRSPGSGKRETGNEPPSR